MMVCVRIHKHLTFFEKFLSFIFYNLTFFFKNFKNWQKIYRRSRVMARERFRIVRYEKKEGKGKERSVRRRTREGERARATNVSRTYTPFVPSEHASLARKNSRGTVREIGPITARPPCGSFDPRREQYARASRFIAERLVNKAPILFFSARLAVRTL